MHPQAKDKARKDLEKAQKMLEPLAKKRAEDPDFMAKLGEEIASLRKQLADLGL